MNRGPYPVSVEDSRPATAEKAVARARILEIGPYPPPRAGWSLRVEFLKKQLEAEGHDCVALNTGQNRRVPSSEYETVLTPFDFVRKVWRYSRAGYTVHEHVNGESPKGFARTILAELLNLLTGKRCYLTFHAGVDQPYFPRGKAPALIPLYRLMFAIPRRIICNSEDVKARIVEYGVPPSKIIPIAAFTRQYLEFTPSATLPQDIETFFGRFRHVLFAYVRIRDGFYLATLIEGLAAVAAARQDVGLLMVGAAGDIDPRLWSDVEARISRHALQNRICIAGDMDHDAFLTMLTRCSLYVRTPTSDGVASSVLEAMALGVPVVASQNGTRPPGVLTFDPDSAQDLATTLHRALTDLARLRAATSNIAIPDTLSDEVRVLTSR